MNKLDLMKIVLSVIDPEYPNVHVEKIGEDETIIKKAIKLAERNGLYYYFIYRLKELGVNLPSSEENRWEEENKKLSEFRKIILLLNEISQDCGINYILIKACTTLPHIPRDVDILVHKEDKEKIIRALENKGMKCIHSDDVDTTLIKGKYMKVDVYTGICYFTVDFIDDEFLWKLSVKDKMFGIEYTGLREEANFLVTLVHSLFGHRSMSLLDFLHMKYLMRNIQDMDFCRKYAYKKGWGLAFDLALRRIESIHERIYKGGEVVYFPYLFDRKFVLQCISVIERLNITRVNKMFLHVSLIQDRVIHGFINTSLYNLLRSFEPIRKLYSSVGCFIRNMRGDKRSVGKEKRYK